MWLIGWFDYHNLLLFRRAIGLTSIPSLSISKLNMLELVMPTWIDCKYHNIWSCQSSHLFFFFTPLCSFNFRRLVWTWVISIFHFLILVVGVVSGQSTSNAIAMLPMLGITPYWPTLRSQKMNRLEESVTILCRYAFAE